MCILLELQVKYFDAPNMKDIKFYSTFALYDCTQPDLTVYVKDT